MENRLDNILVFWWQGKGPIIGSPCRCSYSCQGNLLFAWRKQSYSALKQLGRACHRVEQCMNQPSRRLSRSFQMNKSGSNKLVSLLDRLRWVGNKSWLVDIQE